jgi:hypothetical protein
MFFTTGSPFHNTSPITVPFPVVGEGISNGNVGVGMGVLVGVAVAVGSGVDVGGMGEGVNVRGTDVGGGVEAGEHPLNKTVRNTSTRKTDPNDCFMTLSPFDLIVQRHFLMVCITYALSHRLDNESGIAKLSNQKIWKGVKNAGYILHI